MCNRRSLLLHRHCKHQAAELRLSPARFAQMLLTCPSFGLSSFAGETRKAGACKLLPYIDQLEVRTVCMMHKVKTRGFTLHLRSPHGEPGSITFSCKIHLSHPLHNFDLGTVRLGCGDWLLHLQSDVLLYKTKHSVQAATSLNFSLDDCEVVDADAHAQQPLDVWLTLQSGPTS